VGRRSPPVGAEDRLQRTELSKPARDLLAKLAIDPPSQIHQLTPGT
jgi:hypothetical protein